MSPINLLADNPEKPEPKKKPEPTGPVLSKVPSMPPPPPPLSPVVPSPKRENPLSRNAVAGRERILQEKRTARPANAPTIKDTGYDVNLLADELVSKFSPRGQLIKLALVAVGAAIIIALVAFGLSFLQGSVSKQITASRDELTNIDRQIATMSATEKEIIQTTKKIDLMQTMITHHVKWSKFFERLEHYTLPSVTYGAAFSGATGGTLTLGAATDTFDHVAMQYLILQQAVANQDFISSFSITAATRHEPVDQGGQSTVTFAISLTPLPSVFENTAADTSAPAQTITPVQP